MDKFHITTKYLESALISLDADLCEDIITHEAKENSISTAGVLISESLRSIGKEWEKGNLSLSQIYMSGVISEQIIDKLLLPKSPVWKNQPNAGIAVFEDFHYLGKRIIHSTLRSSGFNIIDLGGGLNIQQLVKKVKDNDIQILLVSVLMLPSALRIKQLTAHLKPMGVTLIVGGAPFNFDKELWKEVGADYYGADSADAIQIMENLMQA